MKAAVFIIGTFLFSYHSFALPDFKKNPVVYGISPLFLSQGYSVSGLKAVTKRLDDISDLGANIIWLQPITPPFEEDGHGYDVMDYKSVWSALGTPSDLKQLVSEAHKRNIKVMLDVVLNHSSFEHPFVKDILKKGKKSPYYEFYQHEPVAGIPYAQHFKTRTLGGYHFIHYFWEHLLNFNYESPKLRDYMKDVLAFWVEEFDIDGYRFDASWGPSTRWPDFYQTTSQNLRALKPDIILMAEDMAGYPAQYEGTNHPHLKNSGFDWAYDWDNQNPDWISKWSFQTGEEQTETIFNEENPSIAADYFLQALSNTSGSLVKPVRYIENNDTPGFLLNHTLEQSMWAAKLMFVLPGVPLIFYGQEAGNHHELFELPSFDPEKRMSSVRPELWRFYKRLVKTRRSSSALYEGELKNIQRKSSTKISFIRESKSERVLVELDFKLKTVRLNSKVLK